MIKQNLNKMRYILPKSWISKSKKEIKYEDEFIACRKIILKIVQYMRDNNISSEDLSKKLGISIKSVNKLIHGQDLNFKVFDIMKYSKILGIELIKID